MSPVSIQPLDALNCPLSGVNLIEASAGTGKTWTIAALFVRLLLEGETPPAVDQLLVVTYTKAATAELRARLRARLVEVRAALADPARAADPFVDALRARHASLEAQQLALSRLTVAIAGFDGAAIYTIHGFCQRVLREAAFESAQTFEAELVADDSALLGELARDFWRRRVVGDAMLSRLLAESGETPEAWLAEVRPYLARPYLEVSEPPPVDMPALLAAQDAAWQRLLGEDIAAGLAVLRAARGLSAVKYKPATVERMARVLERLSADARAPGELDKDTLALLAKLTPASLEDGVNKGQTPPAHPLFGRVADWLDCVMALRQGMAGELARLKLELIRWVDAERASRRQATRSRGFDDLLTDLAQALQTPVSGDLLAAHVARSFKVALIDEFQDTDPIQYAVFRRCFVAAGAPVFLVGDPKQAIYSFRGADIFAYLDARADASHHYTLDTNRRSAAPLVAAVNALFARPAPFVLPGIDYHPVGADPSPRGYLAIDDGDAPLTWLTAAADDGKALNKADAADWGAAACADEIARLINLGSRGGAHLVEGDKRTALCGGHMAVLVATHREGELVRQALRVRGVASVALTQQSVFASVDARELLALVRAWAEPASERLLRAALATSLSGLTADALYRLTEDEGAWEAMLADNLADHVRWRELGFAAAWRGYSVRSALAGRLLASEGGERRLTNLAHLAELIQRESEAHAAQAPLLAWFEGKVATPGPGEEAMLRLESDADLVKIVTIHTSKGLQYPLVFCPFLWDGKLEGKETPFWRFRDGEHTRLVPALLADSARDPARRELLAEKLRLLYVALTRAQYRQVIAWRQVSGMQTSALAWLIHADGIDTLAALDKLRLDDAALAADLARLGRTLGAAMHCRVAATAVVQAQAQAQLAPPLALAQLPRKLYTPWRVTSFTALTQRSHGALAEAPDYEQALPAPAVADDATPPEPRFAFPRGSRAGSALHAIFEAIDFAWDAARIRTAAEAVLTRFGFDCALWLDAACDLVARTLAEPLAPGLTLAALPSSRRLVELNFTRPLARLSVKRLRALLGAEPTLPMALRAAAATLDFASVEGYLSGAIDLAFEHDGAWYLVDYKSNHLGAGATDYAADKLAQTIGDAHYYLQYLIYAVALRRYLASRGVAAAPIEVRYLFLRGLDGSGAGVWRATPCTALLDALDACFDGH